MKKVIRKYNDDLNPFVIKKAEKGICLYECEDIYVSGLETIEIEDLIEQYNNDADADGLKEYLDLKDIECSYLVDGYYTQDEFIKKYEDIKIIDSLGEVLDCHDYYNGCEEVYFYTHQDGSNWRDIELEGEGDDVIFLETLAKENTYTTDLYYNIDQNEFFTVDDSFYQGTLLEVKEIVDNKDIKQEHLDLIKVIKDILNDIEHEVRVNNKMNQKDEGFIITLELTKEELEAFDYIGDLYYCCELDEDNNLIITNYYN